MRKSLGTLVILAIIVALIGYSRGWFGVSTEDQPGETSIEVKIDTDKIKQDAGAAAEKAREFASDRNGDRDESSADP